ncbi:uroporphyrinogen-III synthase [Atheta coriaria]|uniref:uroporphyrinogen-III synthase n=1 Tax=Dalotia coriaria TaxID=877792 RepID=UPI0031F442C4
MQKIILFKTTTSDDSENSFETLLTKENFQVFSIKTLEFEFLNLQELKTCLDEPVKYAGIIFTSPRCVTSVLKALNGDSLHDEWNTKKNYGVGPKTVECARAELNLECLGAQAGNANNLGDIIIRDFALPTSENIAANVSLPFLYPKGNLSKDSLKQKVQTHDVIVYETITNCNLEQELTATTDNFTIQIDYVVFFSPSGVKAVQPHFSKVNNEKLKVIAIGPTTEASLKEMNIPVHGTAEKPSAESLIALLKTF